MLKSRGVKRAVLCVGYLGEMIRRDFGDVLDDLHGAGCGFDAEWFAPHFEFRYPVLGRVNYLGIDLELRQATEPWYVMGEEPAAGAMARPGLAAAQPAASPGGPTAVDLLVIDRLEKVPTEN